MPAPQSPCILRAVDMHAAGEPVRIVESGYPALTGATLLEKRREAHDRFDHLRRRLMLEPRGHGGMYEPTASGVIARVRIAGNASYTSRSEFIAETEDPFANCFELPRRFGDL